MKLADTFMRSPIFYMGNKHKLLKQIIPLFPDNCKTFIDVFGGSGVVAMNYDRSEKTIYNEINPNVIGLVNMIKNSNLDELNSYYESQIEKYNLRTKSKKTEYKDNSDGFYKLREDYNKSDNRKYEDLFLLLCYSINHLLRFNSNDEFNASNGSDSYNEKNFQQLKYFQNKFKNIDVWNKDVFEIDFSQFTENDYLYFDPPYKSTKPYTKQAINYEEFYDYCRRLSENNIVVISEYNMPEDFECIWQKERSVLQKSDRVKGEKAVEKLFIYRK